MPLALANISFECVLVSSDLFFEWLGLKMTRDLILDIVEVFIHSFTSCLCMPHASAGSTALSGIFTSKGSVANQSKLDICP